MRSESVASSQVNFVYDLSHPFSLFAHCILFFIFHLTRHAHVFVFFFLPFFLFLHPSPSLFLQGYLACSSKSRGTHFPTRWKLTCRNSTSSSPNFQIWWSCSSIPATDVPKHILKTGSSRRHMSFSDALRSFKRLPSNSSHKRWQPTDVSKKRNHGTSEPSWFGKLEALFRY